jgi:hypothetical protein
VGHDDGKASPAPPPPTDVVGRTVVVPDVERITATISFDVATRTAHASATVDLVMDGPGGRPALDLRQQPAGVRLDGVSIGSDAFPQLELGGAPLRVLDVALDAGSRHRIEVDYLLDTPEATGAEPIGWEADGVRFDLWMSDLHPGRYLEMWIPAPLCHDRFVLSVDVAVTGTDRPHTLVTNAGRGQVDAGANRWTATYPGDYTSLSPLLVLAPAESVEQRTTSVTIPGRGAPLTLRCLRHIEVDADLAACEADTASWLAYLATRYGPWVHGDEFTAFIWGPGRGMEYDGATTAAVAALEHEVFHSWFGRGVKPARASDGWIDEAWTSWATMSRRSGLGRFAQIELALDEDPVVLCPPDPWSRYTPIDSYGLGARVFAGIAHQFGGADRLRSAMAAWYRTHAGGFVTTDGLEAHLRDWSGVDITPWWDRYVHGRA